MPAGIIADSLAVAAGGTVGFVLAVRLPPRLRERLPEILGMAALAMGINLIVLIDNLTYVILALILGAVAGEMLELESRLMRGIRRLFPEGTGTNSNKNETLINSIALFCVSGTGIFGAMVSGFAGDHSVLYAKAVLDFFSALIFGATAGYAVALIAIPQFIILMAIFGSSGLIYPWLSAAAINDFKATGGIITLAIGLKLTGIKPMKIINMLPALILILVIGIFF